MDYRAWGVVAPDLTSLFTKYRLWVMDASEGLKKGPDLGPFLLNLFINDLEED